ncbi:MAG: hypothetical protein WBH20_13000 [Oceanisphaera sp.]|uniref:hypothetical protein n=1 Tax=Oceanisphaera sp. TaxID=1929979 RepID=UPI003C7388CE
MRRTSCYLFSLLGLVLTLTACSTPPAPPKPMPVTVPDPKPEPPKNEAISMPEHSIQPLPSDW